MQSSLRFVPLLLTALVATGCGPSNNPAAPVSGVPKQTAKDSPAPPAKSPIKIELRTVDIDGYHAELAKHQGKVVMVDFWATWCGPCTKQFPHTVDLHKKYASQGLDVISLSFDDEGEESEAKVRAFLAENEATFTHLRSAYSPGVECAEKFEFKGELPHYRLYDRAGKLRESWDGEPEGIEKKIEELLKAE